MRRFLLFPLFAMLAGCAGHLADYVGPRQDIIAPQLARYRLSLGEVRCVADSLAAALTPRQLRLFAREAGAVRQSHDGGDALGMRDLLWVATSSGDPTVHRALTRANGHCREIAEAAAPPPPAAPPPDPADQPARREPSWLNLGAADSGQSIAVDASTIEDEGENRRAAWFRLTDPGAAEPNPDIFRLQLDCAARTINALARRRLDASGAIVDYRDYPDNPLPVEDGTVMEIAFLSLCS